MLGEEKQIVLSKIIIKMEYSHDYSNSTSNSSPYVQPQIPVTCQSSRSPIKTKDFIYSSNQTLNIR